MNQVLHGCFYSALDDCNFSHQSYDQFQKRKHRTSPTPESIIEHSTARVVHIVDMKFDFDKL